MAKAMKGVVSVIGAVASVLAVIPSPIQPIAAVVATAASIAGAALNIIAPEKPASAQGQQTSFKLDPQSGIPYAIGRTLSGGWAVHRDTWGADNANNGFAIVWSGGGPIQAFEAFQADQTTIAFDGAGNAVGGFKNFMYLSTQLGACPSPALASPVAGFPGWGGTSKLSGYCSSVWVTLYDKKGKKYATGLPRPGAILQGVKVYDPRLDSTYPGGAGACRALNEATYVYSENPWLHGLTWALGRWQNGVKVLGVGMKPEQIAIASFVDAANIADANAWKAGGIVSSVDDKWEVLKMLAQAGGGQCFRLGAKLTAFVEAPRVAVATIRESDIVGKAQIATTQFQRSRINRVVPVFRSEAHGWEQVPGAPVAFPAFEAEDGQRRTAETEFVLVQQSVQAAQLAAYEVLNSREFGPIDLELKIEWLGIEPGDLVLLDMPNIGLANQPALALARGLDPGTGNVALSLRSETASKHAIAMGRTTTVAASPSLVPPDLSIVAAPGAGAWTGAAGLVEGPGGTGLPILVARGAADNPNASHTVFEYRPIVAPVGAMPGAPAIGQIAVDSTGAEFVYEAGGWARRWMMQATQDAGVTVQEFSAVTPQTSYQIAVSYVSRNVLGARLVLGPLLTGSLIASNFAGAGALATASYVRFGDGTVRSNAGATATDAAYQTALGTAAAITGQGALATQSNVTASQMSTTGINLLPDPFFTDSACWTLGTGWAYATGSGVFPFTAAWLNAGKVFQTVAGNGTLVQAGTKSQTAIPGYAAVVGGETYLFRFPVISRIFFTGQLSVVIRFFDAAGNFLGDTLVAATDFRTVAAAGETLQVLRHVMTAPAGATRVMLRLQVDWSTTQPNALLGYFGPPSIEQVARLGANGTVLRETGAALTDAAAVTGLGTAAAIAGQGALATANTASWASQVAGRPAELVDGRLAAGIDASGDLARNLTTARANASQIMRYAGGGLFVGELAADITGTHTAAAIAGQGALATLGAVNPSSGQVLATGSFPPSVPDNSFSYTSTTNSVTISWPALTIYRADGTTVAIGAGSQAITGLGSATSFKVYPYVADAGGSSGSISFVANGTIGGVTVAGGGGAPTAAFSGNGNASAAAAMNARGHIPMVGFVVATTSSGSGGGGGGGSNCLHPSVSIGDQFAGTVEVGDHVPAPLGLVPVLQIVRRECSEWFVICCNGLKALVATRGHLLYRATGEAVRVEDLRLGDLLATAGDHVEVTGLSLDRAPARLVGLSLPAPHLHYAGPLSLLCHNGTDKP